MSVPPAAVGLSKALGPLYPYRVSRPELIIFIWIHSSDRPAAPLRKIFTLPYRPWSGPVGPWAGVSDLESRFCFGWSIVLDEDPPARRSLPCLGEACLPYDAGPPTRRRSLLRRMLLPTASVIKLSGVVTDKLKPGLQKPRPGPRLKES